MSSVALKILPAYAVSKLMPPWAVCGPWLSNRYGKSKDAKGVMQALVCAICSKLRRNI